MSTTKGQAQSSDESEANHRTFLRSGQSLVLCGILYLCSLSRSRGDDRLDYRYEDYSEEGGRMHVETHGVYFSADLAPWISLKGNYVNDAVSGATPLGQPFLPGTNAVNLAHMRDLRHGAFLEPIIKIANHTLSPQASYSIEHDYRSIGLSLSDAIDFNDKNTTLSLGLSQSLDHVLPNEGEEYDSTGDPLPHPLRKNDTDAIVGITQLLNPDTILSVDLTLGYSSGFLNDPYKRVLFDNFPYNQGGDPANPNPFTVWPEHRPDHKFRQVLFLGLSHNFEQLHGAVDSSYRLQHDSFGIISHTLSLQWNQKIGKYVIASPLLRFYTQSQADFYGTHFPGDPTTQGQYPLPDYYSSDYRLSAFNSYTLGLNVSVQVWRHGSIDLAYKRYVMEGTDDVTNPGQYPTANAFTIGASVWF